jgi:hypothetical protein
MEARTAPAVLPTAAKRLVLLAASKRLALLAALLLVSMGARRQSANFIVETPDPNFAAQVAQAAERYRRDLAVEWLGQAMPNWAQPCVMTVQAAPRLGAGGATPFVFDRGEVFGWRMTIQGSQERILDSVLPHEITHMIFASRFRRPLPRWADEGGATTVEHTSERDKYRQMLYQFLRTDHGIAFNQMFAITEYPRDMNEMMALYSQGYSLAEFLIQTGGRRKYVEFLADALHGDDWPGAVALHYGVKDLGTLQDTWLAWVAQGSPLLKRRDATPAAAGEMLASNGRRPRPEPNLIYRVRDKQSPPSPELAPVHMPSSSGHTPSAVAGDTRSVPATVLPTSGWHAAGQSPPTAVASRPTPSGDDSSSPTQVTRPQPPEEPPQRVLR